MADIKQFVSNLQDFLEYKKEEGFQTLEVSPETLAAIRSQGSGITCRRTDSCPLSPDPCPSHPYFTTNSSMNDFAGAVASNAPSQKHRSIGHQGSL